MNDTTGMSPSLVMCATPAEFRAKHRTDPNPAHLDKCQACGTAIVVAPSTRELGRRRPLALACNRCSRVALALGRVDDPTPKRAWDVHRDIKPGGAR